MTALTWICAYLLGAIITYGLCWNYTQTDHARAQLDVTPDSERAYQIVAIGICAVGALLWPATAVVAANEALQNRARRRAYSAPPREPGQAVIGTYSRDFARPRKFGDLAQRHSQGVLLLQPCGRGNPGDHHLSDIPNVAFAVDSKPYLLARRDQGHEGHQVRPPVRAARRLFRHPGPTLRAIDMHSECCPVTSVVDAPVNPWDSTAAITLRYLLNAPAVQRPVSLGSVTAPEPQHHGRRERGSKTCRRGRDPQKQRPVHARHRICSRRSQ